MIVGSSFNATDYSDGRWNIEGGAGFSVTTDTAAAFHGVPSERLTLANGPGSGSVNNRGLGNGGMVFEAGKEYEGFIFAAASAATATLVVKLEDYVTKKVLAQQVLSIQPHGGAFNRYNFSLTPSASTGCMDINAQDEPSISCGKSSGPGIPTAGHTCVKCAGQFSLTLLQPGSVAVNYVFLQPGQWGRLPGLPVLKSAGDLLQSMGITAIRQGGSYASSSSAKRDIEYYQWDKWTGDAWTRPSRTNGVWRSCLLSGWGPFEMIDMCNALGIEPVITTTETSTAASFADLVEYCHGNASTAMGKKRIADGHPSTYDVKYFELGNEQYNSNYVDQVEAMEAKARELGMGKTLHYMFPQNNFLNAEDVSKASKLSPRVDSQMLADIHIGGGGAVGSATKLFDELGDFQAGAVNAETNAGTHVFSRAMSEALDLNDWFNSDMVTTDPSKSRLHFRAASFCMGGASDWDAWDQGISFFLPNATWLQPPGYIHQMIHNTWQPNALQFDPANATATFSAQKSDDGKTLVLRYVNDASTPTKFTVNIATCGPPLKKAPAAVWTLSSNDLNAANPPGNPTLISPVQSTIAAFGDGTSVSVAAYSYTIIVAAL